VLATTVAKSPNPFPRLLPFCLFPTTAPDMQAMVDQRVAWSPAGRRGAAIELLEGGWAQSKRTLSTTVDDLITARPKAK